VPYFERRPYSETNLPHPAGRDAKEIGFLKSAHDVLSLESGEAAGRFRIGGAIRPGGCGRMVLDLALDKNGPPLAISLTASDLVGPVSQIPAHSARVSPSTLTLLPGASAEVGVTVCVPPDAAPGVYSGSLSASGDEVFTVVFEAEVG
jgi:hypothetical protein